MHRGRTGSFPQVYQRAVIWKSGFAVYFLISITYNKKSNVTFRTGKQRQCFRFADILIEGGLLMKQCMDSDNLHRRLKKIIGQVQAIDRMIDEDIPCEDVLSQINAAKSALHKVGQIVLEGHINHCVKDGIEHGDVDATIASFTKAVERFANMK